MEAVRRLGQHCRPRRTQRWAVPRNESGSDIRYVFCNDRARPAGLRSLAILKKHVLLAIAPDHQPRRFSDLDSPGTAGNPDCGRLAAHLKEIVRCLELAVLRESLGFQRTTADRAAQLRRRLRDAALCQSTR
jgi:hypothetical protein